MCTPWPYGRAGDSAGKDQRVGRPGHDGQALCIQDTEAVDALRGIKEWGTANLEGGVCFSRSFTCRKNILDLIYTPHKDSFYNIINVLFLSRDLSHPFLSFYYSQDLHHFVNNLCNVIYFLSMTVGTRFVELIGVFLIYVRFANHNVFC